MRSFPTIGWRIIKTSISVMLCLLLAHWLKRPAPIYACTAAIIVTRESVELSLKQSIARITSTVVGCLFAMFTSFFHTGNEYCNILVMGIGCALTIYFCVLIKHQDASALGAVTYLLLTLTHLEDKYAFTLTRIVETLIGIIIALSINILVKGNKTEGNNK